MPPADTKNVLQTAYMKSFKGLDVSSVEVHASQPYNMPDTHTAL